MSSEVQVCSKCICAKTGGANYGYDLSLDPDTANNYLILSDGNMTATNWDCQNYPDRPGRFSSAPQVLCKQGLTGRHYFEVEWGTSESNAVGVALVYKSNPRRGDRQTTEFGYNGVSWYFGINHNTYRAWHANKNWTSPVPDGGCSRVGVYLDWAGGSLSFYNVSSSTLTHVYTFQARFTDALYPALFVNNKDNYATLCCV